MCVNVVNQLLLTLCTQILLLTVVLLLQFFVGCNSMVCDVYGIRTDRQFVNTLEDNIHEHGALNKLISDCAQVEISEKVQYILCTLVIGSWQSEPQQCTRILLKDCQDRCQHYS